MNEKLNFNDLSDLLSVRSGHSKKEADRFLKEFFSLAESVIARGETLKIAGLGTFKPVWVADRASVNVQTGESFKIAGHYKLSFTPEKSLREAVNEPFSCFETELLNDDYDESLLGSPETESIPDEGDEEREPVLSPSTVEKPDDDSRSPMVVLPGESVSMPEPEPAGNDHPDASQSVAESLSNKNNDQVVVTQTAVVADADEESLHKEKQLVKRNERNHTILKWVASVLLGCCVCAIGYVVYMVYMQNEMFLSDDTVEQQTVTENVPASPVVGADSILVPDSDSIPFNRTVVSDSVAEATPVIQATVVDPIKEVITNGVFLTKLALKYYGHKAFWVYIYEENKAHIPNPDAIPIGTELIIPPKEKYGIDEKDTTSVKKAKALAIEILDRQK